MTSSRWPLIPALLLMAGTAFALPPLGAFSVDLGANYSSLATKDIEDIYKPSKLDNHVSAPVGFQGGVAYNVSESFQLGVGVEEIFKQYKVMWPNGDEEDWKVPALGIVGRIRWLMPGSSPSLLYAIGLSAGSYKLSGATVTANYSTDTGKLNGSTVGGALSIESEYRLGASVAVAVQLGYRLATIRSVSENIQPLDVTADLLNGDGSKARFDYSGPFLSLALHFYIGGDGSSVTSQ